MINFISESGLRCRILSTEPNPRGPRCHYFSSAEGQILEIGPPDLEFIIRVLPKSLETTLFGHHWTNLDDIKSHSLNDRQFRWDRNEEPDFERVRRLLVNFLAVNVDDMTTYYLWKRDSNFHFNLRVRYEGKPSFLNSIDKDFDLTWSPR